MSVIRNESYITYKTLQNINAEGGQSDLSVLYTPTSVEKGQTNFNFQYKSSIGAALLLPIYNIVADPVHSILMVSMNKRTQKMNGVLDD